MKRKNDHKCCSSANTMFFIGNILFLALVLYFKLTPSRTNDLELKSSLSVLPSKDNFVRQQDLSAESVTDSILDTKMENMDDMECKDPEWCSIPMPKVSHFYFPPPTDPIRWKKAQILAASGDLVLLQRIKDTFSNSFDFLDGDRVFRSIHHIIDIFIDNNGGIDALTPAYFSKSPRRLLDESESIEYSSFSEAESQDSSDSSSSEEGPEGFSSVAPPNPLRSTNRKVVPDPYNYRINKRSPIVQLGYMAFDKDLNSYFSGNHHGGSFIKRNEFLVQWNAIKNKIDIPFIAVCALNENWGMLSTMFPNRTAGWGQCCEKSGDRMIYQFLEHDKTLLLVINQHSNITHPKILTIPRGLPLQWERTKQTVWDSIRYSVSNIKKQRLLFASASSWGKSKYFVLLC